MALICVSKKKKEKELKTKNGTGEMGNHVVHSEQCETLELKKLLGYTDSSFQRLSGIQ